MAVMKKEKQVKQNTQVLSCRVSKQQLNAFEIKCLENRIPMSRVLQQAVAGYLKN
jgi:hypothetical protein